MIGRFGDVPINLSIDSSYWRFVPGVGLLHPPHAELALSDGVEFWTVQRANSLGFLDREPIDPARAAESCHISIIGDSFVEAKEVPISDKLQVRLEEIAAHEAPHLDVTTSAFGIQRTGQVNQLPFYDRYARRMSPDMVVLVFFRNDAHDNSTKRNMLRPGYVPERLPYGQAALDEDSNIRWLPPAIDFRDAVFTRAYESRNSWRNRTIYRFAQSSYFIRWLGIRAKLININDPVYERFQPPKGSAKLYRQYQESMNPLGDATTTEEDFHYMESWVFTSFALEQFKRRADHDGATLMVLATLHVGGEGNPLFERLSAIAESLDIPVVSQYDYIVSQGGSIQDAYWETDVHWTTAGHLWAVEAVWEHIEEEWRGQCPQVDPQQDVAVGWTYLDGIPDEERHDYTLYELDEPFSLWYRFHTPDGETRLQTFPASDMERYRSMYESVKSRSPTARSDWNVHFYDDGLTYLRESCSADDRDIPFFMHVFPEDESDLPRERQSSGFENLVFYSEFRGVEFDGICMVSIDLPEYKIARISTGQFIRGINSKDSLVWGVHYNFALPETIAAVKKLRGSGHKPEIRSNFDVYIDNDQLIYVKDSCTAHDRDLPFFLHVFPSDENDLPDDHEESGFDNLGFELIQKGGEHDGGCFAAVELPEYEIDYIRTGQVVKVADSEDVQTWRADYNFALPEIIDAMQDIRQSGRDPDVSSTFDVYINDGRLLYAKSPCNNEDDQKPFFLHVFPADDADLPAGREESGFDNLGFELMQKGGVHDGRCFAAVELPNYEISSIKTGQFSDGVQTWSAHYNLALPEIMDAVRDLQQSGTEPYIRSDFDVYINDGRLLYANDSCNIEDGETPFFLHVFPADDADLPAGREESGFDNLGFELVQKGGMHDGVCFAAVDLPNYEISSIRTGQVADSAETWRARYNFALPGIIDAVQKFRLSGREPDIRSNFDVYIDNDQLIYAKDSCDADDRDTPFFLHVFPGDENDLAEGREESGFNNLGFELMQRGGVHDGDCFAVARLPEYGIANIRTGQWIRGEGNVWEANIDFE